MRPFRHALHVLVLSVLVAAFISAGAGLLVPSLGLDDRRPEHIDTADLLDYAPTSTTTVAELLPPLALTRPPAVTVAPGSLAEANDQGDPTFVPPTSTAPAPSTTAAPATSTTGARTPDTGHRWEVSSTVYCLDGTTASGEPVGPGIVAVHTSRFAELNGTRWYVQEGPPEIVGRTFTVRDKGPGAEFDVWMGDRPDCPSWGRYTYGRQRAVVVPA